MTCLFNLGPLPINFGNVEVNIWTLCGGQFWGGNFLSLQVSFRHLGVNFEPSEVDFVSQFWASGTRFGSQFWPLEVDFRHLRVDF